MPACDTFDSAALTDAPELSSDASRPLLDGAAHAAEAAPDTETHEAKLLMDSSSSLFEEDSGADAAPQSTRVGAVSLTRRLVRIFRSSAPLRFLALDFALSSWGDRMWGFGVPILFVSIFGGIQSSSDDSSSPPSPSSSPSPTVPASTVWPLAANATSFDPLSFALLPASLFEFGGQLACVLLGTMAGSFVDRYPRRNVVVASLIVQNTSVALTALLLLFLIPHGVDGAWLESVQFWLVFVLLTLLGALARLASLVSKISLSKDWLVVLVHSSAAAALAFPCTLAAMDAPSANAQSPASDATAIDRRLDGEIASQLAVVNAAMRGIGLLCEICAPLFFGVVHSVCSLTTTLLVVAVWNVVSFVPETLLVLKIYAHEPRLANARPLPPPPPPPSPSPLPPPTATRSSTWATSVLSMIRVYVTHRVFLVSLGFSLLFLTCLQPGFLLTAFLTTQNVDDRFIALFRGSAAIVGIAATVVTPLVLDSRRLSIETAALGAVSLQLVCLLPCLATLFFSGTTSIIIFMLSVTASRFALYSFDLIEVQIMQTMIAEGERGVVNGAEGALTNLATMLGVALGIVFPNPAEFRWAVIISITTVAAAVVCVAVWRHLERRPRDGHLSTHVTIPMNEWRLSEAVGDG
jgi:iron-regulated transporter 1